MAAPPGRGTPTTTQKRQGTGQLPRRRTTSRRRVTLGRCRGRGRDNPPTASPISVCADRAARPDLRREDICYCSRARRSGPLAGSARRARQVRWCHLHPTPPGCSWAHDGARHRSRHRSSSVLRSPGVVKAVVPGPFSIPFRSERAGDNARSGLVLEQPAVGEAQGRCASCRRSSGTRRSGVVPGPDRLGAAALGRLGARDDGRHRGTGARGAAQPEQVSTAEVRIPPRPQACATMTASAWSKISRLSSTSASVWASDT